MLSTARMPGGIDPDHLDDVYRPACKEHPIIAEFANEEGFDYTLFGPNLWILSWPEAFNHLEEKEVYYNFTRQMYLNICRKYLDKNTSEKIHRHMCELVIFNENNDLPDPNCRFSESAASEGHA